MRMKPIITGITAIALAVFMTGAVSAHGSGHWGRGGWWYYDDNNNGNTNTTMMATRFRAMMNGGTEIPAVTTAMRGSFSINARDTSTSFPYSLNIRNGSAVTEAHLHCALPGQNGPAIAYVLGNAPGGLDLMKFSMNSSVRAANLLPAASTCPTPISNLSDLLTAMRNGQIYVNVHTAAHPDGEIRGWLMPVGSF